MASSVVVKGLAALEAAFNALPAKTDLAVQHALDKTALAIQKDAKKAAPVLTGRLRASIAIRVGTDGVSREIYSDVEYAIYVELGTLRMRAQPFMFPALNNRAPDFIQNLKDEFAAMFGGV